MICISKKSNSQNTKNKDSSLSDEQKKLQRVDRDYYVKFVTVHVFKRG
jgi:hypothetical protein